jgi:predicted nucleic acid-binding protein
MNKSKLSEEDFNLLLTLLERRVKVIPIGEFEEMFSKAEELLKDHLKDVPYIALALKLKCPFWTYEKRFDKIEDVACFSTEDVARIVKE